MGENHMVQHMVVKEQSQNYFLQTITNKTDFKNAHEYGKQVNQNTSFVSTLFLPISIFSVI